MLLKAMQSHLADMRSVLGIDAAWTAIQPSGVALVVDEGSGWRLARVAASYASFTAPAGAAPEARPPGRLPDAEALLTACSSMTGSAPALVAIDMPLSRAPITARRAADNAVSTAYGARHCSTHTPSAVRPGRISDDLTASFAAAGYPLLTGGTPEHALIEVYPHPALVELARADRRLPYKAGKARAYWPMLPPAERRTNLLSMWDLIVALLEREIGGVADALTVPTPEAPGVALKAFEDKLDAVVCAWVGTRVLAGAAIPFGDNDAAIWIPAQSAPIPQQIEIYSKSP
ncbi:DUF429 domain-containing protein [Bosea sp. RCC_152_1]|uniref:DUF429 domain-containing protein n=1 Tax=Bosea sp. RCC_152_1 TaxID=3239228 RepID=UPI003523C3C4